MGGQSNMLVVLSGRNESGTHEQPNRVARKITQVSPVVCLGGRHVNRTFLIFSAYTPTWLCQFFCKIYPTGRTADVAVIFGNNSLILLLMATWIFLLLGTLRSKLMTF